jgi:hypothetical protein
MRFPLANGASAKLSISQRREAMTVLKILAVAVFAAMLCAGVSNRQVLAQSADQTGQAGGAANKVLDQVDLDTQLYLIVATNQEIADTKMPPALEPVIKQLRSTLPFKNYRVSATLLNRVKNDGRLNLKWIGGPLLGSETADGKSPSFNDFKVNNISLMRNSEGVSIVRLEGFGFGARIPIQTYTAVAANAPAMPVLNYESTGLQTDISMREGEPVIVGTLNVGPSGEAIILVMSAKRSMK